MCIDNVYMECEQKLPVKINIGTNSPQNSKVSNIQHGEQRQQ